MNLKEPIKVVKSEHYLLVIEDADGVEHFWLPDGTYDGYCRPCSKKEKATKLEEKGIDNVNIGDLTIEDAGDLGVNFNNRMKDGERVMFVNKKGAEALRQWLNERAKLIEKS